MLISSLPSVSSRVLRGRVFLFRVESRRGLKYSEARRGGVVNAKHIFCSRPNSSFHRPTIFTNTQKRSFGSWAMPDFATIMGNVLVKSALTDVGIQFGCYVIAAFLKTEKFFDLSGAATFIVVAIQSLRWGGKFFLRQRIQTSMVLAWSTRLGIYLFWRVLSSGQDQRFDKFKDSPTKFIIPWAFQAIWITVTLLPTIIQNAKQQDTDITGIEYAGWALWLSGFLMEIIADSQKSSFKADPSNEGKFIQSGLWSIVRHPNYLGEILLQTGLYIASLRTLQGWEHAAVISPLFTTLLLTKVSGIPLLEKIGEKKWGSNPHYQDYLRRTSRLIPYIY